MNRNDLGTSSNSKPVSIPNNFEIIPSDEGALTAVKQKLSKGYPTAACFFEAGPSWDMWIETVIPVPSSDDLAKSCKETTNSTDPRYKCRGHCIVITGFSEKNRELEFKNSWGLAWQDEGYGRLSYDYFTMFSKDPMVTFR